LFIVQLQIDRNRTVVCLSNWLFKITRSHHNYYSLCEFSARKFHVVTIRFHYSTVNPIKPKPSGGDEGINTHFSCLCRKQLSPKRNTCDRHTCCAGGKNTRKLGATCGDIHNLLRLALTARQKRHHTRSSYNHYFNEQREFYSPLDSLQTKHTWMGGLYVMFRKRNGFALIKNYLRCSNDIINTRLITSQS